MSEKILPMEPQKASGEGSQGQFPLLMARAAEDLQLPPSTSHGAVMSAPICPHEAFPSHVNED